MGLKIKLQGLWDEAAKAALALFKKLVGDRIKDPVAKQAFELSLEPSTAIINALSDQDPDNAAQVKAIVLAHVNQNIIPFGEAQFNEVLEKMGDEVWKEMLQHLANVPFGIGKIYTDGNPDNEKQLLTFLESWLENPEVQKALVGGLFGKKLLPLVFKKNPEIVNLIMPFIEAYLLTGKVNFDLDGDGK